MSEPVLFGDVCMKDAEELRDIAAYFDSRGKKPNGDFLREVANRHEILAGAYATASSVRDAARAFFAWANKTWPNPGRNENHPWNRLGVALSPHDCEIAVKPTELPNDLAKPPGAALCDRSA